MFNITMFSYHSGRCKDSSNVLARQSTTSLVYRETETFGDNSRTQACSSSSQVLENFYSGTGEIKVLFLFLSTLFE